MKKFLLKILLFTVYAFLLQVVFPYVVDPFNVFHAENIRVNGVEPNKNYIKMKHILKHSDIFDGFLFGSSRVGAIHTEKIHNEKIYNMTYSIGVPCEHLENIKTFISNDIIPVKVYVGIDDVSFSDANQHIYQPLRCPYEYLLNNPAHFYSLYLSPYDALRSLFYKNVVYSISDIEAFYQSGWWFDYKLEAAFDWKTAKITPSISHNINNDDVIHKTVKDIQNIVNICRDYNIELVIFTNPMHWITYAASVEKNHYFKFLELIAEITDFYNFSSLNDVTLNNDNYLDTSHYRAEVGDMIIEVICNGKIYDKLYEQGFGVKVTNKNINEFITMLKKQYEDFKKSR